ncbi:6-phosphofructokinase [Ruminococcaceae bacterium OttesenSCG-928-L11]|nr:6-phosphofructokinase [Ruminococcaceae bacterium OttesenSCG-928-L11]
MSANGKKEMKTIGILTSGGDAPGMNAVVRSVTRTALFNGMNVKGIFKGYSGLMNSLMQDMTLRSVSDILQRGGTMLYSARCPEFKDDAGVEIGKQNCLASGIDGLVVCGGDGSFRGARDLSLKGIPCIGVPGTIDNDIASSEYTIGFDTAVRTVVENIDRLRDTSQSHDRCSVVEVMGRHCGDIALHSGICCGAVSVLVPEIEFDIDRDIIQKMKKTMNSGKNHFIVIVAEGVTSVRFGDEPGMSAHQLAKYIEEQTGVESRATVLGHIQRGGTPSPRDRVVASQMGHYAVELLRKGIGNRVVAMKDNHIVDYDILEALEMKKTINMELYRTCNEISI